jgi:hypothetical protein
MGERRLETEHRWSGGINSITLGDRIGVCRGGGGVGAFGGHFLLCGGLNAER